MKEEQKRIEVENSVDRKTRMKREWGEKMEEERKKFELNPEILSSVEEQEPDKMNPNLFLPPMIATSATTTITPKRTSNSRSARMNVTDLFDDDTNSNLLVQGRVNPSNNNILTSSSPSQQHRPTEDENKHDNKKTKRATSTTRRKPKRIRRKNKNNDDDSDD